MKETLDFFTCVLFFKKTDIQMKNPLSLQLALQNTEFFFFFFLLHSQETGKNGICMVGWNKRWRLLSSRDKRPGVPTIPNSTGLRRWHVSKSSFPVSAKANW